MRIRLFNHCLVLEWRGRCRHEVVGICPRCFPSEVRTLRNKKLALALAWLERLAVEDPHITQVGQCRRMAADAYRAIGDLQP